MSNQRQKLGDETAEPVSSGPLQPSRNAPLVIVSERGRHSDESRRIVRAQAARASAAQSRVTRARNREEREGSVRDDFGSPGPREASPTAELSTSTPESFVSDGILNRPLVQWLATTLGTTTASLLQGVSAMATAGPSSLAGLTSLLSSPSQVGSTFGAFTSFGSSSSEQSRMQLPLALPRGFVALQQRIDISNDLAVLLSRTSCFDFGSPGVEERLNQLLRDLILGHVRALISPLVVPGHPIQGHLRIACTCLTIFQGQRADGGAFTETKYRSGLEAAWSEATLLDQGSLAEPKSADASLWAIFIINVTTGSTTQFFHHLLLQLLQDLGLQYWADVRSTLLNFIYPVSFLDEPCKMFFEGLQPLQAAMP